MGVVLAVAGSAVGLGNFLRFPGLAAKYGGAFLIPYFIALILLGLPLMWIEWTIGRFGGGFDHSTAPGMFHSMREKNRFIKYFGVIGIFGPMLIFMFYTYVESWLLGYGFLSLFGNYDGCTTTADMKSFLEGYQGQVVNEHFDGISTAYVIFLLTFAINISVVWKGLVGGIEKLCKWAMPVLLILAIVLLVRVFTLGTPDPAHPERNVSAGLGFLWNPDWSQLRNTQIWLDAAGQVFFSLSIGIGVILTYSSYLTKKDDVALNGLTAASANEIAEVVLGGSIVIPAAFVFFGPADTAKFAEGGTFDLGFLAMPLVLQQIPYGHLFGFIWFMLLFLAGVTSSISLAQPAVAFLEDEFGLTRKKAIIIFGLVTFLFCHMVIFWFGKGAMGEFDFWGGTFCLLLFGLIEAILFGWVFGMDRAWTELHVGSDITIPKLYRFVIKYITPVALMCVLGAWLWQKGWKTIILKDVPSENLPYVLTVRISLLVLFLALCVLVWLAWRRRGRGEQPPCE
jgi:SNF family Na+-dependent transporter